jgi:hypothetical protein
MALIPVFIGSEILLSDGQENQKMRSMEICGQNRACFAPPVPVSEGRVAVGDTVVLQAADSVSGALWKALGPLV